MHDRQCEHWRHGDRAPEEDLRIVDNFTWVDNDNEDEGEELRRGIFDYPDAIAELEPTEVGITMPGQEDYYYD